MIYSVGNKLGSKLTGIEKAMINRQKLFKENSIPSKLIFASWSPRLYLHASIFQINANEIFSIYDLLQESVGIEEKYIDWINYWKNDCNYTLKFIKNTNDIRIYENNEYRMYVHFIDSNYKRLDYINHFDTHQRKIRRDLYDSRGFLSCKRILTTNQKIVSEHYYTPKGEMKFEKFFNPEEEKPSTQLIIYNSENDIKYFNNDQELSAFAIENLYKEGDIFLSDKNINTAPIFNNTSTNIPVLAVLHSTHIKNIEEIETSNIKNTYKSLFDNLERFSGLIVSTQQQRIDVSKRIKNTIPVTTIPVGYKNDNSIDDDQSKQTINYNKLISVARYSPEKQITHQIELISKLVNEFPNIQLHLYGFGREQEVYKKLIQKYNLENNVLLRGFLKNLNNEIKDAYISLITSNMEGFNLGLLEMISEGIPAVGYNSKYGPSELIINEKNSYLVPKNDQDQLYKQARKLLLDKELRDQFSKQCIEHSNNFSSTKVLDLWKELFLSLDIKI